MYLSSHSISGIHRGLIAERRTWEILGVRVETILVKWNQQMETICCRPGSLSSLQIQRQRHRNARRQRLHSRFNPRNATHAPRTRIKAPRRSMASPRGIDSQGWAHVARVGSHAEKFRWKGNYRPYERNKRTREEFPDQGCRVGQ